ncbi:MAG: carbohydrate-binding protein [Salinivirgaceae bacterium]|jgi:beta-glucanase (GH16 family)|nr:carbohydrate-binding protein [Salinivirgaceae bacterium]
MKQTLLKSLLIVNALIFMHFQLIAQVGDVLWEDNFNSFNTNIWIPYEGDGCAEGLCNFGNNELQYYKQANVSIGDIPNDEGNKGLVLEANRISEPINGLYFTSGKVLTQDLLEIKYGVVEIRMSTPYLATGLWPAAWLLGTNHKDIGWPKCGEIDMMEQGHDAAFRDWQGYSGANENTVTAANLIWDADGYASIASDVNYNNPYNPATSLANRFVTYRMYWDSESIRFTVSDNGTEYDLYTAPFTINEGSDEFQKPFYLILNMAVGGDLTDAHNKDQVTAPLGGNAKMIVDYIKVSQWNGQGTVTIKGDNTAETGTFGVYTDETACNVKLAEGSTSEIWAWGDPVTFTAGNITPFEGANSISWQASQPGAWFGGGVKANQPRNMSNYTNGNLKFNIKIPANVSFRIGATDTQGGENFVLFPANQTSYGLVRNGEWAQATIPISELQGTLSLVSIDYMFTIASSDANFTDFQVGVDNIYWEQGNIGPVDVTSVDVDLTSTKVKVNTAKQLTAYVLPSNATNKGVSWTSSNTIVATVNASGVITALAEGTSTISCITDDGGFTSTCAVTVTKDNPPAKSFTFGTIPDTQNLSENDGDASRITKITQWFVDNREALDINFVASLGDMTQWGAYDQWVRVRRSYDVLKDAGMPYAPCEGNHDPDRDGFGLNTFFPESEFLGTSTYGGSKDGDMKNAYYLFTESGMDFIIVVIQTHDNHVGYYDWESIEWANNILTQHADRRAILVTHDFFEEKGLINDVITQHDNLFLAVCGHSCAKEVRWTEQSPSGNTVNCIMTDYQCEQGNKAAVLRYYTFKPDEDKIYAYTYDAVNNTYFTGEGSEFVIDYGMEAEECTDAHTAYQNNVVSLPGTVEAENYNTGCPGVPFFDTDATNQGSEYRSDAVDIETCTSGGFNVGWTETGEWLNYQVNVSKDADYDFKFNVASGAEVSPIIHLEINGQDITGPITISGSTDWQDWVTIPVNGVSLTQGLQHVTLVIDNGGVNINHFSASIGSEPTTGFTIGLMPDTQNMSKSDSEAQKVGNMTQFFIDNEELLNLHSVVSVGDMTYGYNSYSAMDAEYARIKPAYDKLKNEGIPYASCMGNHDHDLSLFNKWFPISELQQQNPYYQGYLNGSENTYYLFTEQGVDFVLVVIETHDQFIIADHGYDYDMASIEWANNIFASYPSRKGIFVTHDIFEPTAYNLVDDVIKQNDNLFMAVCGHSCARPGFNGEVTGEKHWTETTNGGSTVHCLLSNYQCDADNGATVRYYTLKPNESKVEAYTYNVVSNQYLTDANSQFSFSVDFNVVDLYPSITNITVTPSAPKSSDNIVVNATITDDGSISSAQLNWGLSAGNLSTSIAMSNSGSSYTATIAAQANGSTVYYQISATDNSVQTSTSVQQSVTVNDGQTGVLIPANIEAEDFTDMFGIDTDDCTEGGKYVGWVDANDWIEYEIIVPTTGDYILDLRVASLTNGGDITITSNGSVITNYTFDLTEGWQEWITKDLTATLQAGAQTIRFTSNNSGWNVNWIEFKEKPNTTVYHIEAEDYAYMDGIDTDDCSDIGGGKYVGWTDAGDWMVYNTEIPAGSYKVTYRVASYSGLGEIQLEKAGGGLIYANSSVNVANGWQGWDIETDNVTFSNNITSFAIAIPEGGFNMNWIEFETTQKSAEININTDSETESKAIKAKSSALFSKHLKVYPNPVTSNVNIDLDSDLYDLIQIHDINGRLVYSQPISNEYKVSLSVDHLDKGVYLMHLLGESKGEIIRLVKN